MAYPLGLRRGLADPMRTIGQTPILKLDEALASVCPEIGFLAIMA